MLKAEEKTDSWNDPSADEELSDFDVDSRVCSGDHWLARTVWIPCIAAGKLANLSLRFLTH